MTGELQRMASLSLRPDSILAQGTVGVFLEGLSTLELAARGLGKRPLGEKDDVGGLEANDALVIAAPEYNGSLCGVVKNAIDWASRKRPQPFNAKHALLLSASPSMAGGNRGVWALRVPLEHLGARVYPDMFSLAQAHQAFDANGGLINAKLQERLDQTIAQFMDLVEAAKHYPCAKKAWIEFLGQHPDAVHDRVE